MILLYIYTERKIKKKAEKANKKIPTIKKFKLPPVPLD